MHGLGQEQKGELGSRQYLLRRFWATGFGYWRLGGERSAWVLTGGLFALILLNLGIAYEMNVWNRAMFDALQQRNSATVLLQGIIYFPLMAISIGLGVLGVYARMTIQRLWRAWLNRRLLDRWLANSRYYQLNLVKGDHANPEYRLAEDLRVATEAPIDFAVGVMSAFLSAVTFILVLWTIGGNLSFNVAGATITIPGFLVIAAVIYAVLASGTMVFIGHRFVAVAENRDQAEAEYRYTLTRLRENAESVALMGGEREERPHGRANRFKRVACIVSHTAQRASRSGQQGRTELAAAVHQPLNNWCAHRFRCDHNSLSLSGSYAAAGLRRAFSARILFRILGNDRR